MARDFQNQEFLEKLTNLGSQGRAEGESEEKFGQMFFPVREHLRALDPEVVLIVGARGAGKTNLFRALIRSEVLDGALEFVGGGRKFAGTGTFLEAFPAEARFPDKRALANFFRTNKGEKTDLWLAYLIRLVWNELDSAAKKKLAGLHAPQHGDVQAVWQAMEEAGNEPILALDRLDQKLAAQNRYIFAGYDELDVLGGANWDVRGEAIKGLITFWATYTRRWRHIRAKLFIRTDLYRRYAISGGADLAKLAANKAEISWNDHNLYGMLIKRIANLGEQHLKFCQRSGIEFRAAGVLGHVPVLSSAESARQFIDRLVGPYMGANFKKGLTFRWVLDHVRDGKGSAHPRQLVQLFEKAAEVQLDGGQQASIGFLDPPSLRAALDAVSQMHVNQAADEWPWVIEFKRVLRGQQVPWERRTIERLLAPHVEIIRKMIPPPSDTSGELVEYFLEVAIFRKRADGRIDVPDLFLAGLELKRKGGVRKS